ncbi:MAG: MarR family winged helix-turn-helix transcriptional regulator [Sphingopyxis sp.]
MNREYEGLTGEQPTSFATQRRVAVFSDDATIPPALTRAAVISSMTLRHHPLDRLLSQVDGPSSDILWVILDKDVGYEALGVIERHADFHATPLVLQLGNDAVDSAWAAFSERDRTILIMAPDVGACTLALAQVSQANEPHFANAVDNHRMHQIDRLHEEVQRISAMLSHLAMGDSGSAGYASEGPREPASPFIEDHVRAPSRGFGTQPPHATVSAREVRRVIRERRMRDELFPADLFADPAWDMLLDLYAAKLDRARVSVSSLCIAAAVPATTALRWIKTLSDASIFRREADQHDGRRIFVALSDQATDAMHRYFARRAEI